MGQPISALGLGLVLALLVAVGAGNAAAPDEAPVEEHSAPTLQQIEDVQAVPGPAEEPTDPTAAEELPHADLDRDEAGELLTSVFGPVLEGTSGIYGELEVERYDSDYEAVVASKGGDGESALLESSLPLRAEDEEGRPAPVDLGLEPAEGELQPVNPLVEVGIPSNLSEGISLPEAGLTIRLAGSEDDREASTLEGSAVFYPDVAEDTDLTVAPNPLGVETMTQLRTPEAPDAETFELGLAEGQTLKESGGGGAEVVSEGKTVISVLPPTALDAEGRAVPVTMTTAGDALTISVAPDPGAAYPILVDPIFNNYSWGGYGGPEPSFAGWSSESRGSILFQEYRSSNGFWGLDIESGSGGNIPVLSQGRWDWRVPHYGESPETTAYVVHASLGYVDFETEASSQTVHEDPFMELYLWSPQYGFEGNVRKRYGTEGSFNEPNYQWDLGYGDTTTRQVSDELVTRSNETQYRHLWVGNATIEIGDTDNPVLTGSNPSGWVNASPTIALPFEAKDLGLGIYALNEGQPTTAGGGGWTGFTTRYGSCTGGSAAPCPRTWVSPGGPAVTYDPSQMPQGEDTIQLQAVDPLGKGSAVVNEIVKVDHTKPALTATGTYGEQGSPAQPTYTVKYKATDGTEAAPQSGAASLQVKVDGKVERSLAPGCATRNCEIAGELTLEASKFGSGTHTVEVTATDGVGLAATPVTLSFSLERPDTVIDSGPEGLTNQNTPKFTYHSVPSGAAFKCSVDGGAYVSCPAAGYTTAKLAEGPHTFEVKAVNGAGLQDPTPAKREFTVLGPPDTTIVFGPEGTTGAKRPTFGYESNNPSAWFECKLDSGSYEPCGPATYESLEGRPGEVLSEGAHSVSVRAVNQLEVADPTPAVASFTVDGTAPEAEITSGPEGPTAEARPTFDFTASGGSVACFLETEGEAETEEAEPPFAACTTSSSYTPPSNLAEGSYVLHLRARDVAMNETEDIRGFSVDTTAPETTITSAPAGVTDDATPTIEFSSSEAESTFQCRYDAEAFRTCSGPGATDTPAALADGAHTFQVRAIDAAGNADATPATATFTLVTDGPQTGIDSGPEGAIGMTEATFTYSTDETASMECSLDGAAFASCPTASRTYTGLAQGEHVFEVRGMNKAGVADPTPARRAFVVDTTAPSTPTLSGPIFEEGGYGLHFRVEASDGSPSTPSSRRSGVESVQILLAGEVVMELGAECEAGICPANFEREAQIPWEPLLAAPAGASVQARAKDGLGHVSTATLEIKEPHEQAVRPTGGSGGDTFAPLAEGGGAKAAAVSCSEHTHIEVQGTTMYGTCGKDRLVAPPKVTLVEGLDGNDVIIGGSKTERIKGGDGADIIRGGGGNTTLQGEGGDDHIYGGNGDDELLGGEGNDELDGGPGEDHVKGGPGNDTLRGGQGPDFLYGGPGDDTVSFADALAPGFAEAETEEGTAGRPNLYKQAKEKASGAGIKTFPPAAEAGVYIRFAQGSSNLVEASNGDPAEGGGTDTLRKSEDERIVGSPFADWIEGAVANSIDPGPGEDMIFNAGSGLEKGSEDWVDGSRGAYTAPGGPVVGMYQAGAEKNVYVIGAAGEENLVAKLSGNQVRITGAVTKTLQVGEALGALVLYGAGGHDVIKVTGENKERPGAVELDGGPGSDELVGGPMEELLVDGIQQGSGVERLNGAGGEDDLAQGEGADKVEGGAGDDLFLNSRICEGDSFYAFNQGFEAGNHGKEAAEAEDNAQFHLLAENYGIYANMQKEELGGAGDNLKAEYELNCGEKGGPEPFKNFNAFEGSPQNDLVRGNGYDNYILGRGGENKLYGGGGDDTIVANNNHPELVIDCGGQAGDKAVADRERDMDYSPPAAEMERSCKGGVRKASPVYNDGQTELLVNPNRKLHPAKHDGGSGGAGNAAAVAAAAPTMAPAAGGSGGARAEDASAGLVAGAFPTTEFQLDETAGTSAANALDEEAPGTYMAKGTGPSVGGPGPVLGGEGALLEGGEEAEEEGSSISLDGETAYVDLNGQAGPEGGEGGYSVSLYVKFAAAAGKREYLFSSAGSGGRGAFIYRAPDGSIAFTTGQTFGAPEVVSEPIAAGGWHQVVASLEGQTISLNVDGFPYELGYGSDVMPQPESSPESLLGAGPGATYLLDGSLDQFTSYEGVPAEGDILPMLAGSRAQIAEYLPADAPEGDEDGDGVPDDLDNCLATPNPDQADSNLDGIGDACQTADQDEDGIVDASDNCPTIYNPEQTDTDGDGVGDACSNLSPEVETGGAKEVKATTATIEGSVDPEGAATTWYFEYGPTTAYGTKIPATPKSVGAGFATVAVSQALTGLAQGTTYHYRLVAVNASGTESGLDGTFTTLTLPTATTEAATAVTGTSALLHGSVGPQGLETTYQFEYGKTAKYGSKTPSTPHSAGSGTGTVAVSTTLSGLEPGVTYHYRVVATSAGGTVRGGAATFTTTGGAITGPGLTAMPVTEPFDGSTTSLSNFGSEWAALGWAGGYTPKGADSTSGWRPYDAFSTVNGAYYDSSLTDTGPGLAAVATLGQSPEITERYFSLWLDMSDPAATTRSGYELRFTDIGTDTYKVTLSRWATGVQTVLASDASYVLPVGSSLALSDQGGAVSAWTDTGSGFAKLIGASDSEFSGGRSGIEGSGNITLLKNFKFGVPTGSGGSGMNAALQGLTLRDTFSTIESPLSEGGNWAALQWDTSTTGHDTGHVSKGWGPYDAFSTVNGAYWHETFTDSGTGDAVVATLTTAPGITERYFSVWLNASSPATLKSGYELRFDESAAGTYTVTISRWQSGTKTTLATKTGYAFPAGSQFALLEKSKTVSAWTSPAGGEFTQLLSAADATFTSGHPAVEASGNITRLSNLRAGVLAAF